MAVPSKEAYSWLAEEKLISFERSRDLSDCEILDVDLTRLSIESSVNVVEKENPMREHLLYMLLIEHALWVLAQAYLVVVVSQEIEVFCRRFLCCFQFLTLEDAPDPFQYESQ